MSGRGRKRNPAQWKEKEESLLATNNRQMVRLNDGDDDDEQISEVYDRLIRDALNTYQSNYNNDHKSQDYSSNSDCKQKTRALSSYFDSTEVPQLPPVFSGFGVSQSRSKIVESLVRMEQRFKETQIELRNEVSFYRILQSRLEEETKREKELVDRFDALSQEQYYHVKLLEH